MKIKNIIYITFLATLLGSCKKDFLDINTNPNVVSSSTTDFTFAAGAVRLAAFVDPNELGAYWSGQWTQSNTYIIDPNRFSYTYNNTNFNFWDTWYDIAQDFQYVLDNNDAPKPYFKGPARVMKAYIMQMIVDTYGDAPYSQAFKGAAVLAPKFDKAEDIYLDLAKQCDSAIADMRVQSFAGSYGTSLAASDVVFGGNTTNWIRFANSLKLRILMRQSRIAGKDSYIISEINKSATVAEGFLSSADAQVNPGYIASTGKQSPIYERWGYMATGVAQPLGRFPRPTTFLFSNLIATADTFRLKRLAYPKGGEPAGNAEILSNYVGVPFGATSGYLAQNTSYLGPSIIKRNEFNRSIVLMTGAAVQFYLAEAKQRYAGAVNLPLTAQQYYENGVTQSFRLTGTTTAYGADKVTALLTSGKDLADWNASPDKLKAIWYQKWVAQVNFSGLDAWAEFRRTNYPNIPASASAPANTKLPLRLFYPSTELGSNPNTPTGQNVFTQPIFWDVD